MSAGTVKIKTKPVDPSMNTRIINRLICAAVTVTLLAWTLPARAFIFDTFGDGFWTVINNGNGNTLVVNASGASQAVATNTAFQQQFELLYNEEDGTFRLRNHDSWLCIGALNGATTNGTAVVTVSTYTAATSQKWNFVSVSSGNLPNRERGQRTGVADGQRFARKCHAAARGREQLINIGTLPFRRIIPKKAWRAGTASCRGSTRAGFTTGAGARASRWRRIKSLPRCSGATGAWAR